MHSIITLQNGLKVIVIPVADAKSVTMMKMYRVGSRYETDDISGAAHFLEHMVFKGTVKRPTSLIITKELDRVGAQYNAFTGKDMTAYYVKIAAEHFELAADVISDITYNSTLPDEEMEKEKGVIIEEIKLYEDNPARYVDDIYEEVAFIGGTLGRNIIGTRETVSGMKRSDLLNFKASHYDDAHSALVVSGYVPENVKEVLEKYFSVPLTNPERVGYQPYTEAQNELRLRTHVKDVEQTHLQLGFRSKGLKSEDVFIYSVISAALGGGMSSILFDQIREKRGLCYYIRMYPDLYEDVGSIVIRAGLNTDKVPEAISATLEILEKFKVSGLSAEELSDAKDFLIGNMVLDLEDSANVAEMYIKRFILTGAILTPEEIKSKVSAVTKHDILRVAQEIFQSERLSVALIAPQSMDETLRPLLKL